MRVLLAMSVLVLVVSCGGGDDADHNHDTGDSDTTCTATTAVSIRNFAFVPACITVAAGQTVTFTNNDSASHTSTTEAGQPTTWASGVLSAAATFTTPALAAGTIAGHCDIHPSMRFTIKVE